ncbi:hypothetical protein K2173_005012 [Erythroxylum novogranatense]|uniref:Uncharacterized protein n=1 Tax=Erythroxylum novogranatense TaxID=1862640 RepID=A0AAV8TB78_9ROSI|nr:hypothetical protein K2173_005012 [Erythroxylum novogranatense]
MGLSRATSPHYNEADRECCVSARYSSYMSGSRASGQRKYQWVKNATAILDETCSTNPEFHVGSDFNKACNLALLENGDRLQKSSKGNAAFSY